MTHKVALASLLTAIGLCLGATLTDLQIPVVAAVALLVLNVFNVWVVWGDRV